VMTGRRTVAGKCVTKAGLSTPRARCRAASWTRMIQRAMRSAGGAIGGDENQAMKKSIKTGVSLQLGAAGAVLSMAVLASACGGGGVSNLFSNASSNDLLFVSAAQTWDVDKDNAVTCQEWQTYTGQLFQTADTNTDGSLTKEEFKGVIKQDRLFQSTGMSYFDTNNDGKLSAQEFASTPNPAFKILDRDKDCRIASNEMVQTRQLQKVKEAEGADPPL